MFYVNNVYKQYERIFWLLDLKSQRLENILQNAKKSTSWLDKMGKCSIIPEKKTIQYG